MAIDGSITFEYLALDGSLEPALAWPEFTLDASGVNGSVGQGNCDFERLALNAGFDDGAVLPLLTLEATGVNSALITGWCVMERLTLTGSLEPALSLPELSLSATALTGQVADGDVRLPVWMLEASTGTVADLTWPAWQVAAVGLTGSVASGQAQWPALQVNATLAQDGQAQGDVQFGLLSVFGVMVGTTFIEGRVTLLPPTLSADGQAGQDASAELILPLYTLNAEGYGDVTGSASVLLPLFTLDALMQGSVSLSDASIVLNTRVRGVTTYDGLGFNSAAIFNGVTLLANEHGIIALEGDTDLGVDIAASVASGDSDWGKHSFKRVVNGYVGYRANGELELSLILDGHDQNVYTLAPRQTLDALHPNRVKFGRGIAGMYVQWRMANRDGADFALERLSLDTDTLARQI